VGVRYAGELLAAFIEKEGGSIEGEMTLGSVPAGLEPVLHTPPVARSRGDRETDADRLE
jgi:hypothetical protein